MSTIKDIANKTGLGLATISKYLNGGTVLEKNKVAIEEAIKELNFTVNEFARGLKTKKSKTVGIVIPELSNVFCTNIITVIEDNLRKFGYGAIVCDCGNNSDLECDAIEFLLNKMVDGIINMPVSQDGRHLIPAVEKNIPVVVIDRMIENLEDKIDFVLVDNVGASESATNHLIENNHKSIGIIVGPNNIFTSHQRLLGYQKAFSNNGLLVNSNFIAFSDYTVEGGYTSTKELLKNDNLTALFVTNYEMTLGAIIAINELGVRICKDLSIVGFDNLQLSQVIKPKLTIVNQPLVDIGKEVANIILSRMNGNNNKCKIITLPTSLQIGESVMKIN